MILTYRLRLRDKHAVQLCRQARAVNFVWNYCNETQRHAARWERRWLTRFDLNKLTSGTSAELGIAAGSIEAVCHQYVRSRNQHRRPWLRFRGKHSLGWVPFKKGGMRLDGRAFRFLGRLYEAQHWREFPEGATILGGSFAQDARGRWYVNCSVEVGVGAEAGPDPVGIDLGLKDVAVLSTGERVGNPGYYRALEGRLGVAQRANKKKLTRTLTAKIANARKDHLHKASARIALAHRLIVVGDVSSGELARTRMAKSVLDASWYTFKHQLAYKAVRHQGQCIEVNEAWTSRTCSSCGSIPSSSPKGIGALGIRVWSCDDCGAVHDRDVNAARNILRLGLQSLVGGSALAEQPNRELRTPPLSNPSPSQETE